MKFEETEDGYLRVKGAPKYIKEFIKHVVPSKKRRSEYSAPFQYWCIDPEYKSVILGAYHYDQKDAYSVLHIQRGAPECVVKASFKALASLYHPDKNNGDDTRFKEIEEAYTAIIKEI